jgi:head-tail adaptor
MSFGKMTERIGIVSASPSKDAEGFAALSDEAIASVRAYKEERHGGERWANMAAYSEATALFRFRAIPGVEVTASNAIICGGRRYRIISAEDVRGRGMYVEVMAELLEGTVR